jgi:hypothetical protein
MEDPGDISEATATDVDASQERDADELVQNEAFSLHDRAPPLPVEVTAEDFYERGIDIQAIDWTRLNMSRRAYRDLRYVGMHQS